MSEGRYRTVLAKPDFKFSAAHFTLFSATEAEPLHGHNYRVRVEVRGAEIDELGILVDFASMKKEIRAACARLDDRTLIPARSELLRIRRADGAIEVDFCERRYRFPEDEVVLMEIENTTVELFARVLWHELAPTLAATRVEWLSVGVEETEGQTCYYEARLDRAPGA